MILGGKNRHSTKVVKLVARAGSEFHSVTGRRRVLSVIRAKGESAYFTTFIECQLFRMRITYYFFLTNAQKFLLLGVSKVCAKKLLAC